MASPDKLHGYASRITKRGYRVVELDAWADPARDQEWLIEARRRSPTESDYQREILRSWETVEGDAYYGEAAKIGRERYVFDLPQLLRQPVIRGWDFGLRHPVCIWMQYAPESDRVFVLRCWDPKSDKGIHGIAAHHFRDVCRWLSGEIGYDEIPDQTSRDWADLHRELAGMGQQPTPPWFPKGVEFIDFAGFEANTPQSISARDPRDATMADVWRNGGINLATQAGKVKARCDVLRRLLFPRADGWPGIVVSKYCPQVMAMLMGGLVFKTRTKLRPRPEDPKKDGHYDDINDALTYPIVAVVPASPPRRDVEEEEYIPWSLG
jgi:hypothetical protein